MTIKQAKMEMGLYAEQIDIAISVLRDNEPDEGYYFADSGGKDSCVTRDILIRSGCKFDAHYNVSPIDPPEIYKFLKEQHPDTLWEYNAKGFWRMVDDKGLPMRQIRWCCEVIKESGGNGRCVVTGLRRAESSKRKNYNYIRSYINGSNKKVLISPILGFTDDDIWRYIRENEIPYCSLYDEGFKRIGCVLCPFSRNIEREELYFPKIVKLWKLACDRLVAQSIERGYRTKTGKPLKHKFKTGEEMYQWWTSRI